MVCGQSVLHINVWLLYYKIQFISCKFFLKIHLYTLVLIEPGYIKCLFRKINIPLSLQNKKKNEFMQSINQVLTCEILL